LSTGFRCSAASAALDEPLIGSASTVRAFLLLEDPGPWGEEALRDSRLPGSLGTDLLARCRPEGVRPLLIRKHGRSAARSRRCFAAYADPHRPWLQESVLDRPEDALDIDIGRLGRGMNPGLEPRDRPLFLVCTHGRHDVCCAELGRPLVAALARSHPEETWECSHIGGDRFAGNLFILPNGLCYGRVEAGSGAEIAAAHLAGRLHLDRLRGRSGYRFPVQAAEWYLRSRLGLTDLAAVHLDDEWVSEDITETVFTVSGGARWRVHVRSVLDEARRLTCQSRGPRHALRSDLLAVEELKD
jgi:hypothetical protein